MTGETAGPRAPDAYFAHVAATINGEWNRRLRRALLIATCAGLLAERYWRAADEWFLDVLDGRLPPLDAVEAELAGVEDPAKRAHAESGLAVLRAHRELLSGRDWVAPLAAARHRVEGYVDDTLRIKLIVRAWTTFMALAAGMIGVALLVGLASGIVR